MAPKAKAAAAEEPSADVLEHQRLQEKAYSLGVRQGGGQGAVGVMHDPSIDAGAVLRRHGGTDRAARLLARPCAGAVAHAAPLHQHAAAHQA